MNRNASALILIVLAIGVYFTFTSKIYDEAKAIGVINKTYADAVENADKLIKVRDKVLNDYNSLSPNDKDRLDKILPTTVDNIRLIIDLNNAAQQKGLVLRGVKASAPPVSAGNQSSVQTPVSLNGQVNIPSTIPTANLDSITVSFSTTASYDQFIQFMRDLEANLRVMDITRLSLKATDTGVYDYTVELKTYWLRQQ